MKNLTFIASVMRFLYKKWQINCNNGLAKRKY